MSLLKRVTEKELIRRSIELASKIRQDIELSSLGMDNYEQVAQKYKLTFEWETLPDGDEGSYIKEKRQIILDKRVNTPERIHFSFYHELMHAHIEDNDDLLSLLADAHIADEYDTIERMCNAGAAELLVSGDEVFGLLRTNPFSASLIPLMCERFLASSLAVAFKMIGHTSHECHLVIAEPSTFNGDGVKLVIIYTGRSSAVEKYSIKWGQILPTRSLLYQAWYQDDGKSCQGEDAIPFASGTEWIVPCDAIRFRGKVFAFFNVKPPISVNQLPLFDM